MLYKQLNEQRTQGEWTPFEGFYYGIDSSLNGNNESVVLFGEKNENSGFTKQIDAAYTCLAVNNLAEIADCLDWFVKHCEAYFPEFPLKNSKESEMLIKAKEALNRIS